MALAVVPAGDVTELRKMTGCSLVSIAYKVDPKSVWCVNVVAVSRENPMCTPASIIASMSIKTYAGPEPEREVEMSMKPSSST